MAKTSSYRLPDKKYGFPPSSFDPENLPDYDHEFLTPQELDAFIQALSAPDPIQPSEDASTVRISSPGLQTTSSWDVTKRASSVLEEDPQSADTSASTPNGSVGPNGAAHQSRDSLFITAQNDWAPVNQKVVRPGNRRSRRKGRRAAGNVLGRRTKDETREGYLYGLLKWPFLLFVGGWIIGLAVTYVFTRTYISFYEHFVTWRGRREQLRRNMRATANYKDWRTAAKQLDDYLGNQAWKEENEFAYYDHKTVRRVWDQMRKYRAKAEDVESKLDGRANYLEASNEDQANRDDRSAVEDLKSLLVACVKNNFVGVENPRLYSQTYYGTKNLVQNFVDEVEKSLRFVLDTKQLRLDEKRVIFKSMHQNYGRTALCLSGGASFAYYHFGVVKALLEEDLLPDVITGTSGGALVAGLIATRTNEELKELLVPALAHKITACSEPFTVWFRRWWKTGARFDSVDWAKQCSWWTHGSMTFREAFERTGRILNVSCVPADPHSPTILCNYLTSPDCVIWSAVLASAAVPGILNPVVLMMKTRDGNLVPYSFGHKWKDGSLRTDIPIKALNLHFNVNFTIVSQVNPHINLFFFSSRGRVGQPVTHRKGRGWRGGFLGSATEQYIKLDLTKWLKILKQLELLPRPLGQDWSQIWLQQGFGGSITIWPKSIPSDFIHILADPDSGRLARMIHEGQQSAFPTVKFIANRLKIERLVERGRRETRPFARRGSIESIISEDDLRHLLRRPGTASSVTGTDEDTTADEADHKEEAVVDDEEFADAAESVAMLDSTKEN